jgi:hypothetical protein
MRIRVLGTPLLALKMSIIYILQSFEKNKESMQNIVYYGILYLNRFIFTLYGTAFMR